MPKTSQLPEPSKAHATCAWCRADHDDIVDLLTHVESAHLDANAAA